MRSDGHLLALMVELKCFNRMGHFPRLKDMPDVVVGHIRRDLGLGEDVAEVYDSDRARGGHRTRPLPASISSARACILAYSGVSTPVLAQLSRNPGSKFTLFTVSWPVVPAAS